MNIPVQTFVWTHFAFFLGHLLGEDYWITRVCLTSYQFLFQSSNMLHSHQQCVGIPGAHIVSTLALLVCLLCYLLVF